MDTPWKLDGILLNQKPSDPGYKSQERGRREVPGGSEVGEYTLAEQGGSTLVTEPCHH